MSVVQNPSTINFVKMSGAGNDFIILDARTHEISISSIQIRKISNRRNIGCDQLIVLKDSKSSKENLGSDCVMEIYNSDGSLSRACGNATRCVASLLISELKKNEVKIQTAAGVLRCWKNGDLISVEMGQPKFSSSEIPLKDSEQNPEKISLFGFDFSCANLGNPHAVTFIKNDLSDEEFFKIGPKVETNKIFPQKTNVEFAKILSDDLIEVRVWERGSGETLACGSGACAVAVLAIKNHLVKSRKITTRFKGGDLVIEWNSDQSSVIMTGGYQKVFEGVIDESFLY